MKGEGIIEAVVSALQAMRPPFALYEYDIHKMVEQRLREAGFAYAHEARIGKGCRIDYLVGDVGIEIKKGKPIPAVLLRQIERYAACEAVSGLVVITQRNVRLPKATIGKPLYGISLAQLWGVALP